MDSTDLRIVAILKKNARTSASAIAKEVGLAVSSVTERIRRLEAQGVILQYTAIVDHTKVEGGITAMIGIKIEHTRYIDTLAEKISSDPHVVSFYILTGDLDFLVSVYTITTEDFRQVHRTIANMEGVASVKTYYILGTRSNEDTLNANGREDGTRPTE